MKKVLENPKRINLEYPFRGKTIRFNGKHKRIFEMDDEEQAAEYRLWLDRYEFILDITANTEYGGDER